MENNLFVMESYLQIIRRVLEEGILKENRTGVKTLGVTGEMFRHDMSEGFPLLTTKKVAYKNVRSELEFFIKGLTDKKWLQERENHIWDDWCNPRAVPYGHDDESKSKMRSERDLGPIYGFQWRHFGAEYKGFSEDYGGEGFDQLGEVVRGIKKDPMNRRLIVSAWNPQDICQMALPPCHYSFQITTDGERINLGWNQRSVDVPLGLPFNIAGYATLLHLFSKETGFKEGVLTGHLEDVHIYENQIAGVEEQLSRGPKDLPQIETLKFTSIFDWDFMDTKLVGYNPHPAIKFPIAV